MRVLVTGAAGFIGSHLTQRLLERGDDVVGLDNLCDFYDPSIKRGNLGEAAAGLGDQAGSFTFVEADIRDRDAVFATFTQHRPEVVVHLAAMAGVRPSIERPDYYAAVNLTGTVNLLDAAAAHGVRRFAFASSSSVYGNNEKRPFAEDDRVDHPISPYAATKKAGELLCHTYWHIRQLPIVCLRFFTVFGPRQRPDLAISKFMRLIAAGEPIQMFGDGSTSRDYTYVDDIVTGICAAIERCDRYRVYNLGSDHPVSLREMIAAIEQVVGKPAQIEQQPMQVGDVDHTFADLTRSRAEIDYAPSTDFATGLARQWDWLRQRL